MNNACDNDNREIVCRKGSVREIEFRYTGAKWCGVRGLNFGGFSIVLENKIGVFFSFFWCILS